MQLTISFFALLVTVLVALSDVEALPAKRGAGMITLPLKRIQQPSSDLHPQIVRIQFIIQATPNLSDISLYISSSNNI